MRAPCGPLRVARRARIRGRLDLVGLGVAARRHDAALQQPAGRADVRAWRLVGGHPLGVGPEAHVAGTDQHDVPGPDRDALGGTDGVHLGGVDRRPLGEALEAAEGGGVDQHAAGEERRHPGGVAVGGTEVRQVLVGIAAAVPVHVVVHGHVGQGVHVGARVRRRHDVLGHVPEARVVDRPPGLRARHPDPSRRAVVEDLEGRVSREERHAREADRRQRDHAALPDQPRRPHDLLRRQPIDRSDSPFAVIVQPPGSSGGPLLQRRQTRSGVSGSRGSRRPSRRA